MAEDWTIRGCVAGAYSFLYPDHDGFEREIAEEIEATYQALHRDGAVPRHPKGGIDYEALGALHRAGAGSRQLALGEE